MRTLRRALSFVTRRQCAHRARLCDVLLRNTSSRRRSPSKLETANPFSLSVQVIAARLSRTLGHMLEKGLAVVPCPTGNAPTPSELCEEAPIYVTSEENHAKVRGGATTVNCLGRDTDCARKRNSGDKKS